ncbi:MAG: flagellar protein FlgN [Planctomycetaceae bacterium]|nr:flagellar protein FlgN [Planctomycetaceae bacterium]
MITQIQEFLDKLSVVQDATLDFLKRKGDLLGKSDAKGLTEIADEEQTVMDRLHGVFELRHQILQQAKEADLPSDTLESLAARLDKENPGNALEERCRDSIQKSRLLRHQSLANWVLAQRTAIHLSQLIEIIGTKGKPNSTYSRHHNKEKSYTGGSIVDLGG